MSNRKNDWNHKNIWNHGYVTTPQAHLYYEISGHGTPILFLHGNSQSHHIFHSYARKLQGSYQVILMDSRGHGESSAGSGVTIAKIAEDAAAVLDNLPLLEELGFSCEDFGGGAVLVREVPADLDAGETSAALEEFAGTLRGGGTLDEKREELLHTIACKSAIKGGWKSDVSELRVLVEKVQSGEVRYCPHGRPVAVKLSRYELEKLFKRA
mgnify:CR=1 FL=1